MIEKKKGFISERREVGEKEKKRIFEKKPHLIIIKGDHGPAMLMKGARDQFV